MRAFAFTLGLIATPAMAADQFDLVCKEQVRYRAGANWESTETRYRIDMDARRWCSGSCAGTENIASVSDSVLELRSHDRKFATDRRESLWIDRRTGKLSGLLNGAGALGLFEERQGTCERAEFTGFPPPERKF